MLPEPAFEYYASPWDWKLIALIFFVGFCLVVIVRKRQAIIRQSDRVQYYIYVSAAVVMLAAGIGLMIWFSASGRGPRILIHKDFVSCGSWSGAGRAMRVPWHHIISIDRVRSGRYDLDVVLRFIFDRRYIGEIPWTDHVRTHHWVNCSISALTDDPGRLGFPADTHLIHDQVVSAWRAAVSNPLGRHGYQELMEMKWENPVRQRALEEWLASRK